MRFVFDNKMRYAESSLFKRGALDVFNKDVIATYYKLTLNASVENIDKEFM